MFSRVEITGPWLALDLVRSTCLFPGDLVIVDDDYRLVISTPNPWGLRKRAERMAGVRAK